jgi:hypothetical protein
MIAKNYMKHPEALRFQRELFSSGYHNSPRIMRLMECIFDWSPAAPAWWTAAKARARALAKTVKKSIADFFKEMTVKAADQLSLVFEEPQKECELNWRTLGHYKTGCQIRPPGYMGRQITWRYLHGTEGYRFASDSRPKRNG